MSEEGQGLPLQGKVALVRKRESRKFQFSQSSKFMHGGARAGAAVGGKVGKPMAARILLMVAAVLISAIRRRSPLQFAHFSSTLKVRRKSSFQGIYLYLRFAGGAASSGVCSSRVSAGKGDVAVGMMRERKALCEELIQLQQNAAPISI